MTIAPFTPRVKLTLPMLKAWHAEEAKRYKTIGLNYQAIIDRADRGDKDRSGSITPMKRAQSLACKAEADTISNFHRQAARLLILPKKDI